MERELRRSLHLCTPPNSRGKSSNHTWLNFDTKYFEVYISRLSKHAVLPRASHANQTIQPPPPRSNGSLPPSTELDETPIRGHTEIKIVTCEATSSGLSAAFGLSFLIPAQVPPSSDAQKQLQIKHTYSVGIDILVKCTV